MNVVFLVMAVILAVGVAMAWTIFSSRSARSLFRDRAEMSSDEIYAKFYADSSMDKNAVSRSLRQIADKLQLPAGKLRPSDSFLAVDDYIRLMSQTRA